MRFPKPVNIKMIFGRVENMEYDSGSDIYICQNNKKLSVDHIRHAKSKTGYISEKTIYRKQYGYL